MSLTDELLGRVNRWPNESTRSYRLQIPRAIDDQLECLSATTLENVERLLEVVAQVAAEAPSHDPVWRDLESPQPGVYRAAGSGFAVFFEVSHSSRVVTLGRVEELPE